MSYYYSRRANVTQFEGIRGINIMKIPFCFPMEETSFICFSSLYVYPGLICLNCVKIRLTSKPAMPPEKIYLYFLFLYRKGEQTQARNGTEPSQYKNK